jgi:hypothetical protein
VAGAGRRCSCYTFLDGAGWIDLATPPLHIFLPDSAFCTRHMNSYTGRTAFGFWLGHFAHSFPDSAFCTRHMIHTYTGRTALRLAFSFWLGTFGSGGFDTIVCYLFAHFTANSPTT